MFKTSNENFSTTDNNTSDVAVKFSYPETSVKKASIQYPCLCVAIGKLLFLARFGGILPIISIKHSSNRCKFAVSKKWLFYSITLQIVYILYLLCAYALRLLKGAPTNHQSEWFVMTIGYMLSDLQYIILLLVGIIYASEVCNFLEKISVMPGRICEMRTLKKHLNVIIICFLICNFGFLISYILVASSRFNILSLNQAKDILDSWISVLIRGLTTFTPTLEIIISIGFYSIIWRKFDYLTTLVHNMTNKISKKKQSSKIHVVQQTANNLTDELEQLNKFHQKLYECLNQLNKCLGVQLFLIISVNLYISIFYCYRLATSANNTYTSNLNQRFHYIVGGTFRMAQIIIYMTLGQIMYSKSLQPIRVLQDAVVVNLPSQTQQQIQTLLLQWNGKIGYLSALGIINIGLWLLPSIIGNVITYLLVAIQFNDNENQQKNVTLF